jgi:hypothetical protein
MPESQEKGRQQEPKTELLLWSIALTFAAACFDSVTVSSNDYRQVLSLALGSAGMAIALAVAYWRTTDHKLAIAMAVVLLLLNAIVLCDVIGRLSYYWRAVL